MKRVVIESPYAGDVDLNLRYLRACMRHCLMFDESPYASHGLYTMPGVLDDCDPEQRDLGIAAGFCWRDVADLTVVYTDLGVTKGMQYGIDDANRKGRPVKYRTLPGWAVPVDDVARCVTCRWPLAESRSSGCVPGDCSYRGVRR